MGPYLRVLFAIKKESRTFQSDFYRSNAGLVSEAAARGHITCLKSTGENMGVWTLTTAGQQFLHDHGGAQ